MGVNRIYQVRRDFLRLEAIKYRLGDIDFQEEYQ